MEQDDDQFITGRQLVYFAAERTLMAWLRASLGLMALGFVIDRFGFFLRQVASQAGSNTPPKAFYFWGGTALVLCGSLMAAVAAVRYLRIYLDYKRDGRIKTRNGILVAVLFGLMLVILGLVISTFLIFATD